MEPPRTTRRSRPGYSAAALIAAAWSVQGTGAAQDTDGADEPVGIQAFTEGRAGVDGFVPLWWSADGEELAIEVPPPDADVLYTVRLAAGLGSNDVGLDRGQLGESRLVRFRPVGSRVLLVAPNLDWRSGSERADEREAVRDSFAESVLWSFDVVARTGDRRVVDATEFLLRDAHDVARKLEGAGQGRFSLDASRGALLPEGTRSFPENTEVEALLTFTGDDPGPEVRATAPDPGAVSLRVLHAFVALPDLDQHAYRPRRYDPRSGYFTHAWSDLTAPLGEPTRQRVVPRHHLTADDPIVYYVDRGAPEPVRQALIDGARSWTPVFEAAGFPGGFRVELLPEGESIHDLRYNTIQWVHRSTRGWSYGMTVEDPRTGEILKGHVTLGALRVRQDILLFEGLLSPYGESDEDPRVLEASLARIRQLAAHEVGHTLGLAHNFAASAFDRASVMDYPAPRVTVAADGELDVSDAYAPGCGAWDELAIRYGYQDFGDDEAAGLAGVLAEMEERGIAYLSDRDARGPHCAHPLANLWDDGADPVRQLEVCYAVRATALARFGEPALREGRALHELERVLVPVYLHHRYQLEAGIRQVGGRSYTHAVRGSEPSAPVRAVAPDVQRRALGVALRSVEPEFLALPASVADLLSVAPPGYDRTREDVDPGALVFDPLALAAAGSEIAFELLLDPERAARLVDQHAADPSQLSLGELLTSTLARLDPAGVDRARQPLLFETRAAFFEHVRRLATADPVPVRVRSVALDFLDRWEPRSSWEREALRRFRDHPAVPVLPAPRRIPPGSPIGCEFDLR